MQSNAMKKGANVDLPDDTDEVAGWAELRPYWATVQRGKDGTVYFVTWAWGSSSVQCAVYPDGTSWVRDD